MKILPKIDFGNGKKNLILKKIFSCQKFQLAKKLTSKKNFFFFH